MSMHKVALTPIEEAGLLNHHLPIGVPSQLSDAFRLGAAYALERAAMHFGAMPGREMFGGTVAEIIRGELK